jgi:hypothetical protein
MSPDSWAKAAAAVQNDARRGRRSFFIGVGGGLRVKLEQGCAAEPIRKKGACAQGRDFFEKMKEAF